MKKIASLFLSAIASYTFAQVDPYKPTINVEIPEISGYVYCWGDEFDKDGPVDRNLWQFEKGLKRGNEAQCYTDRTDNAYVKDGQLVIVGKKEHIKNPNYDPNSSDWREKDPYAEYSSASIIGKDVRHFLFGRIEVRARLTPSNGYFPAIWTCGYNKGWPANGEIDIMEHYWSGGKQVLTANFCVSPNDPSDIYAMTWNSTFTPLSYYQEKDSEWLKKYHVWRMDWDEEKITLFVDNEARNSIKIKEFRNGDGSIAFYNPQYMWLNLALKNFGHGIDERQIFEVDYFRVYQKTKDVEPPMNVTELKVEEYADTWAKLSWNPATDNVGIYRYDVYVNEVGSTNYVGSTTENSFTVKGLKPDTKTRIFVRALDKAGNYSVYDSTRDILENGGVEIKTKSEWEALSIPNDIYTDILLPTQLQDGSLLTWTSYNEDVVTSSGIVSLPKEKTTVNMRVKCQGLGIKNFTLTVHPRDISQCLMIYYPFNTEDVRDNGLGDIIVYDMSGNDINSIVVGNATVKGNLNLTKNTPSGFASNGYLILPQRLLDNMRSFTVVAQVKANATDKSPRLFDFGSASSNSIFGRIMSLAFGEKYKGETTQWVKSSMTIIARKEYQLAYAFDAASHTATVYVNGKQLAQGTFNQEPWELAAYSDNVKNYVGRTQWWNTSSAADNVDLCGTIDDFRLFNIALNADELKNIDMLTDINDIEADEDINLNVATQYRVGIYDLSGRRIDEIKTKGIYICNGKKVII